MSETVRPDAHVPTGGIQPSFAGLISPLMEKLDGRRLRLNEDADHGHLLTAYAVLHRRTARAIKLAVDAIEAEEERRHKEGLDQSTNGSPVLALDAFLDAIYRVAELFEFYEKAFPKYIRSPRARKRNQSHQPSKQTWKYVENIEQLAKPWKILCNRCKHNHAFLVPVEGMYEDGAWVTGFSLYSRDGDLLQVDQRLHRDSDAYSYNWALRALIGDMLEADVCAAEAIAVLPDVDGERQIKSFGISLPYLPEILRVLNRPMLSMPREGEVATRAIQMQDQQLRRGGGPGVEFGTGKFRMRLIFDVPGLNIGINVRAPYFAFECKELMVQQEEGAPRLPLPGFLCFQVEGLIVPPGDNTAPG